jgi:hypothetical protein
LKCLGVIDESGMHSGNDWFVSNFQKHSPSSFRVGVHFGTQHRTASGKPSQGRKSPLVYWTPRLFYNGDTLSVLGVQCDQ